jgi:hypothetical protein
MFDVFVEQNEYRVYRLDDNHSPVGAALLCSDDMQRALDYAAFRINLLNMQKGLDLPQLSDTDSTTPTEVEAYISPRPAPLFQRYKEGITIFKGADNLRYMFIITSNSYQDREKETITTKSLKRYVDAAWSVEGKCLPRNRLEFWHTKQAIGDIVWCDMAGKGEESDGPFLIELAKERPNRSIKLQLSNRIIHTTVKDIWDAIEALDIQWGASHGFKYPESAKSIDGTYHYIAKFETSILPLNAAANQYTYAEVIDMNARDKFLEDFTGLLGIGNKARKGVQTVKGKLDKQGIQHKAKKPAPKLATKGLLEDLTAKIDEIIGEITDGDTTMLRDKLLAALAETLTTAAATVDAPAVEATETEYMEDDPVVEDELPDPEVMAKQLKAAMQLNSRLINSFEQLADDNAATRQAVVAVAEAVKSLKDTAKLPDQLTEMTTRMKALEDRFKGGPRRASQDTDVRALVTDEKLTEKVKDAMTRFEEPLPGLKLRVED